MKKKETGEANKNSNDKVGKVLLELWLVNLCLQILSQLFISH